MRFVSKYLDLSKCKLETVQNEIDLLRKSDNQFIIKYADSYPVNEYSFCIVTEYCEVKLNWNNVNATA